MRADSSVTLDLTELLQLRHLPAPSRRHIVDANGTWLGTFRGRRRGHGTDYDDLRVYCPGDDVRHIHWRASARTHELQTRLYREEKEHRTCIICDFRPCMFTGAKQLRANRAATLCARLLWQACREGTRVTLVILTGTGFSMIDPGTGHATAINACVLLSDEHARAVQALQPGRSDAQAASIPVDERDNQFKKPSEATSINNTAQARTHTLAINEAANGPTLESLLQWLIQNNQHSSTLLWVSGLDFEGDSFAKTLGELGTTCTSIAVYVDEPVLHAVLPSGEYHYKAHASQMGKTDRKQRHALIDKATSYKLKRHIERHQHERVQRFDKHRIALLSTVDGDDNIIAALRQQGHLP